MRATVELAADEDCASRPVAAPVCTDRDATVMQRILGRLRALARDWSDDRTDFLLCEPDLDGHRHWIRVPDCAVLLGARRLTAVGFFGRPRAGVDHLPIHELEPAIVDTPWLAIRTLV